jgi:hypothetical protein|tara:strand:- start:172 stop:915 length:744 start_codon:yes stop_codon:yes gene_type:complete
MKKLVTICLTALISFATTIAVADDHANSGPLFYGQSMGFVASDAPAVLAAMERWRNSKAGKAAPNTVVLLQNIVNGDYRSTHGVNIFYPNGAAMDASTKLLEGNKEWAEFQRTLFSLVEFEWENTYAILRAKANDGDVSSTNPVSIVYGITVTDSATFMSAFNKLWNSAAIQEFPGAVYLGASIAAGTTPGTHFVTFVADSRGKLTEAMMAMQSSKEMASYMESASGARTPEATNMFFELKRWANGG